MDRLISWLYFKEAWSNSFADIMKIEITLINTISKDWIIFKSRIKMKSVFLFLNRASIDDFW